ncbi:frequency clock protein [Ophiostoma piceae UAMH 11346]|uniref:Frequency clock protein n=1 Tax=Ophiostoma piceae (strain UAMH 11346) TaxID=1262450 RepID=S3BSL4_OPHP1|nr:frequency clock protein [Ophiostoma piceae UAMH 11346]
MPSSRQQTSPADPSHAHSHSHSHSHPLRPASVPQAVAPDISLPDAPDLSRVLLKDHQNGPETALRADVQSTESGRSSGSLIHDAKKWFDTANNNLNTTYDTPNDDGSPYFQKRDLSGDEINNDVPLMSPQHPPPFVPPGASFMPPNLGPHALTTPRSSSADDYRSVIDDLTIENKRLKEELKRYKQSINRDVLEKEKLFEIKVHGLPRRKKQELEATLRDFAASLGDSPSSDGTSQRKREKSSVSSKERSSSHHHHHPHSHSHSHSHNPAQYSSGGSRSKHASNSSSRSRPVDSAYASMSTGAHSNGPSLARQPFGGSKARASSEQKVERYLQEIPQGLHPNYGLRTLGDKDKKKLIVRRLEQLFTGKIGGRFARQGHSLLAEQGNRGVSAGSNGAATALGSFRPGQAGASSAPKLVKSGSGGSKGSGNGGSGSGVAGNASAPGIMAAAPKALAPAPVSALVPAAASGNTPATALPFVPSTTPSAQPALPGSSSSEPLREARIQSRHAGHKPPRSQDNGSTSNSNSNGEETTGIGSGNAIVGNSNAIVSGSGNANGTTAVNSGGNTGTASGSGPGKSPPGSTLPEQRPTRPLDLDPDRVQVPSENMEYIRHLGLVPPEIGPRSVATTIDVSPDANGWVYLNLLSNLAQLHIFNVAPDFIRQAVVEKSTKFQLSPDGQKVRWRGGTDGTKFSSDGSAGDQSQQSLSTDGGDGSDENGHRKRNKTSGHGSVSGVSGSKKRSKNGLQNSGASSSFHYKPLFVHQASSPMLTAGEDMSTQDSDMPDVSAVGDMMAGRNKLKSKTKSTTNIISNMHNNMHNNSMSMTNSNSNIDISRYGYEMSRSGSSNNRKRRKSDGVLVYYSGMPFCTDLAGDSGGEGSPTTDLTSTDETQDSVDKVLQGRPTTHRSSSGSLIPFRPLTDYLSLSREEWGGLGLLGIGTVGRGNGTGALGGGAGGGAGNTAGDNMSSSASYNSTASIGDAPDNEILFMENAPSSHAQRRQYLGSRSPDTSSSSSYLGGSGGGGAQTDITTIESKEPYLEASGLSGVMPDDHFSVRVTTQRPFRTANAIEYDDDMDTDIDGEEVMSGTVSSSGSAGVFSMSSLAQRLAALKKQTAPISAAVPTFQARGAASQMPLVVTQYLSVVYGQREPVKLPQPAMFYPPFSQSSESEESEDLLDDEVLDDEDSSMFASSSVISRRANPHHSVKQHSVNQSVIQSVNPSVINASEMMSSGEDGDVEAGEFGDLEDST